MCACYGGGGSTRFHWYRHCECEVVAGMAVPLIATIVIIASVRVVVMVLTAVATWHRIVIVVIPFRMQPSPPFRCLA